MIPAQRQPLLLLPGDEIRLNGSDYINGPPDTVTLFRIKRVSPEASLTALEWIQVIAAEVTAGGAELAYRALTVRATALRQATAERAAGRSVGGPSRA
ncbi:hypothetical protein [Plantactinospora sp. KLBMP9567]|jgi:hypothetical protein|uniref:hypothetical protein n=1 Tax=Plantactinospora sp. KLBMP9567 TaxID=3085900 RepID=UPI002981ED0A|nr:hypothetical protein [Plantactinospora sp. KLBMP9567]MDW5326604.1 hypothetical protein [Plantactinospora sp. KLBMP9567]